MPRYAPLPLVSIDPRNEFQLVQNATQTVYEASNRTLNDFSSGNPLSALLEGQAFAQGEFLFWANQLPEKILIEWIGPFLGAMRKLGTPATAQLTITVSPLNAALSIPIGTIFATNPQLTGGRSYEFVTYTELVIPAGETSGQVSVYSKFVGSEYNVPAKSISVVSSSEYYLISASNPKPASGGSDVETYDQVKERFFTLIRRKNPVSEADWTDFFIDLYGVGTTTVVQPARSSKLRYNYDTDYRVANGQVSFFVLGPEGVELNTEQLRLGQNALNLSLPLETQGHVFPITLSEVQYNLTLEVNPNGSFGSDFRQSSLLFRNRLFNILYPNSVFPISIDPSVSDINSALSNSFSFRSQNVDPRIVSASAYNIPNSLCKEHATYTKVNEFFPSDTLMIKDDLIEKDSPNPTFYPVLVNFTPFSSNLKDQPIYGNLALRQIRSLSGGVYNLGDVVYYDGASDISQKGLHVVLEKVSISSEETILSAFSSGKISGIKLYSPWVVGNTYNYSTGGVINPDIIPYLYEDGEFIPATPSNVPLSSRPGALIWVVAKNFTLSAPTSEISTAQSSSKLGSPVTPQELTPGNSYSAGSWVYTPQVASGPRSEVDPFYHYVDVTKGAVKKYAYVVSSFTYNPDNQKVSDYFDGLVTDSVIKTVSVLKSDSSLPVYKYKARFKVGQYMEYRESSMGNPSYYVAAQYFTPSSTNIQDLLDESVVISLTPTVELKNQFTLEMKSGFSGKIRSIFINDQGSGYVSGSYSDVPLVGGDGSLATADIIVTGGIVTYATIRDKGKNYRENDLLTVSNSFLGGSGSGFSVYVGSIEQDEEVSLTNPARMFTFFKGDKTFFRNGSKIQLFTATSSVSPTFNFEVYFKNGIFIETDPSQITEESYENSIPFFNPEYDRFTEDSIIDSEGKNIYRVMRAFTPLKKVTDWSKTERDNSPRYEEYAGNLLKYVTKYECDDRILPQFGERTSGIKLGNCQINIIPKSQNLRENKNQELVYVWEGTQTFSENSELSWYSKTTFAFKPPNYRDGTLSL